jgi:LysR family transcriptional regulator, cell division regulator
VAQKVEMTSAELPSPTDLRYFLSVANSGNISRAATRLGISQSSLSIAIQRLEATFDVPLLIRGKAGVKPTRAGQRLMSQARHLLEDWQKLRADVLKEQTGMFGRFSLGCHLSIGLYTLSRCLPGLLAENPNIEVSVQHDYSHRITEDVVSDRLDFGICCNPVHHPDLVIRRLYRDEVTLWTNGSEQANEGRVLVYDPSMHEAQVILRRMGKLELKFGRIITANAMESVASLVAAGLGVGILPGEVVETFPPSVLVPYAGHRLSHPVIVSLVYRADAQKSAAGQFIARYLENKLKGLQPMRRTIIHD